jgi:hypothetical protein
MIKYPSSVLSPPAQTALNFVYRPRKVPYFDLEAVRHDNTASSGVREVVWERTDTFLNFDMEWVVNGTDVQAWLAFEQSALQGIPFDYYPDATLTAFTTYYVEDKKVTGAYKSPGYYAFKHRFYLYRGWP